LRFASADLELTWPRPGLRIARGGFDGSRVALCHPRHAGLTLHVADRRILADPALAQDAVLAAQLRAVRRSALPGRLAWLAVVLAGAVVVAGITLLLAGRARLADLAARRVPSAVEALLGQAAFDAVRATTPLVDDAPGQARIEAVAARLAPALGAAPRTLRFHVAARDELNAFALPGGDVVIHRGLLKALQRPEELAGVLAHELAHVTRRHALRGMLETAGLSVLVRALLGDTSGLLAGGSELLLQRRFSRDLEREADDVGWDALVAARIDPRGMIEAFERLRDEHAGAGLLATHPATEERIAHLRRRWAAVDAEAWVGVAEPGR